MKDYKKYFPIFEKEKGLVYLDSAATSLKPKVVLDKLMEYYTEYSANIHRGLYPMSERASEEYEKVRGKVASFIGAKSPEEIVFTSGTTAAINLVARAWAENNLKEGDEILVSEMEHHSNFVVWQQLAKRKKLSLRILSLEDFWQEKFGLDKLVNKRTKLMAVAQISNVLGKINPIEKMVAEAKKINPEIRVLVDGAQSVGHVEVDVQKMGCDFFAFSGHKMYGPTGVGALYVCEDRMKEMEPADFGGGMIGEVGIVDSSWAEGVEKFEAGTPPIAQVIGMGAAVDFLMGIGMKNVEEHESKLLEYLLEKLGELEDVLVVNEERHNRIGVVAMVSRVVPSHDLGYELGEKGICVRSGLHCAQPLHNKIGEKYGTTRISLGVYNSIEDINKLVEGIKKIQKDYK